LKSLDDRALAHVADYFRALSEPLRLRILNALREHACNVGELTELLDCSQANVSKHLQVLFTAGFVDRRKDGVNTWYRLADQDVLRLCDLVCGQMADRFASQAQLLAPAAGPSRPRRR